MTTFTMHPVHAKTGWTDFIRPVKRGYLVRCCQCSLVHELQFKATADGVIFRARRVAR